ncbi:hypothetical protein D6D17_05104 [Aureobasidium pullulans]|nr:hypothetical protein D6D17_05104 [Aureobasidium pullulans]
MPYSQLAKNFDDPHHKHAKLSKLVPYSALILTVSCVVIFLVRMYLLEPLVKRYTSEYKHLDQAQRRSFINHYVAASIKLILIIASVYPAISVISGHKNLQSPFAGSSTVKVGDVLLCTFQVFTAMYIFELFYREKVSHISGAHHIGAIIITQTAVVLFLDPKHQQDAELEFIMCLLWGFFDIVAEFWPHAAVIVYRTWPKKHMMLADIFLATAILEIIGTIVETVTVFSIFFSLWKHWTLEFKVLSPTLHLLFSCAQLWGARVFWVMSQQHRKAAADGLDPELVSPERLQVFCETKRDPAQV